MAALGQTCAPSIIFSKFLGDWNFAKMILKFFASPPNDVGNWYVVSNEFQCFVVAGVIMFFDKIDKTILPMLQSFQFYYFFLLYKKYASEIVWFWVKPDKDQVGT